MNIDQLRARFPDENACRQFFESVIWQPGRVCPHCQCQKSYHITGCSARPELYECAQCKRQFTVTTKTPMHSTKLCLWKWLLVIYLYDQFLQVRILGCFGQMGWHLPKKRLESGPCGA